MLTMDQVHNIRSRYYEKGENISQIAKHLKLDWKTVRKCVDRTDFNAPEPTSSAGKSVCPKLDPYKALIDDWLNEDKKAPRKQRHTALRVYNRLKNECHGFNCSYRTVATYYSVKRAELFKGERIGFLPLEHKPGECQADFGDAVFYENGTYREGKYLNIAFPHSNKGYLQLKYGENMECLLEGLDAIFRHINCVPDEIWFDNASTVVTKILRNGGREITERFMRFQEHYRFKAVYTNPDSGYEKGAVEAKVGYHRRNMLVPVPRFMALDDYNRELLAECEKDADREHYRYEETIEERFAEDLKGCLPLPETEFDLSGRTVATTNKWGKFYLNKGMHEYSVSPKHICASVNLKLTSDFVIVMDENYREIVKHDRLYGDKKQHSMNWLPYLKQLSLRPRAFKYSGVYDLMPEALRKYLEGCTGTDGQGFENPCRSDGQNRFRQRR